MLSEYNNIMADGIAEGILLAAKQVCLTSSWYCGSIAAAVFEESSWPCLVAMNNKWKVTVNKRQLQQQKRKVAATVSLCHLLVTVQAVNAISITAR